MKYEASQMRAGLGEHGVADDEKVSMVVVERHFCAV